MFLQNNKMAGAYFSCIISGLAFSLLTTAAVANINNVTGSLKLTATINHQPAFSAVSWTINPRRLVSSASHKQWIQVTGKHSTTLELAPGNYRVVLRAGNKKKVRDITIIENGQHQLVINIDR